MDDDYDGMDDLEDFCICIYCYTNRMIVQVQTMTACSDWAICQICGSSHAHDMETT